MNRRRFVRFTPESGLGAPTGNPDPSGLANSGGNAYDPNDHAVGTGPVSFAT